MRCDTMNGACVVFGRKIIKTCITFCLPPSCLELVLKSVFESKIYQSQVVLIFRCLKGLEITKRTLIQTLLKHPLILSSNSFQYCALTINELITYSNNKLLKSVLRDDYRGLIELSIICLVGNNVIILGAMWTNF